MIRIYGASDDLVELEGNFTFRGEVHSAEEIGSFEKDVELIIGDPEARAGSNARGVRVTMQYAPGETGVWEARVAPLDEGVPIPWRVVISSRDYTAIVDIEDAPPGVLVTWVGDPTNTKEAA